jgi:hypothetical protein
MRHHESRPEPVPPLVKRIDWLAQLAGDCFAIGDLDGAITAVSQIIELLDAAAARPTIH